MTGRRRRDAVVVVIVGAAAALLTSTQPWLLLTLSGSGDVLEVTGTEALPLLAPLSLAALALGLALSIVGVALRYAFGLLAVVIGVALTVAAVRVAATQPIDAYAGVVTAATGLAGDTAVTSLVGAVATTAWAWGAVAGAVVTALGGILTLVFARGWTTAGRKYRTAADAGPAGSRPHDAIDDWDDLSRGDDPTAGESGPPDSPR